MQLCLSLPFSVSIQRVNSMTAMVTTDCLDQFGIRPQTEKEYVWIIQIQVLLIGGILVASIFLTELISGDLMR